MSQQGYGTIVFVKKATKFRRRKADRPQEIVEAAADVFAEKGFAASKLDDIAARAGVTKGTLYLYFDTKEALFEAVVKTFASSAVKDFCEFVDAFKGSFADLLPHLPAAAIERIGKSRIPAVAKMVIGEARNFPNLARIWRSEVFLPLLTAMSNRVRVAQKAGEVAAGPPEIYAISVTSPVILVLLAREVFGVGLVPISMLTDLANIHGRTLSEGMLLQKPSASLSPVKKLTSRKV
jgi:AcrR family transcriptional regulator